MKKYTLDTPIENTLELCHALSVLPMPDEFESRVEGEHLPGLSDEFLGRLTFDEEEVPYHLGLQVHHNQHIVVQVFTNLIEVGSITVPFPFTLNSLKRSAVMVIRPEGEFQDRLSRYWTITHLQGLEDTMESWVKQGGGRFVSGHLAAIKHGLYQIIVEDRRPEDVLWKLTKIIRNGIEGNKLLLLYRASKGDLDDPEVWWSVRGGNLVYSPPDKTS